MHGVVRGAAVLLLCGSGCSFRVDRTLAPGQLQGTAVLRNAQSQLVAAVGAVVMLEGSDRVVTVDSEGTFSITGLPAGKYAIDLSAAAGAAGPVGLRLQGLTIASNGGLDLGQIELGALGAIHGTVTLTGGALPVGGVAAVAGLTGTPITGGTFLFPALLPGDYAVSVLIPQAPGALVSPPATVHVNPGATVITAIALTGSEQATTGTVQGTALLSGEPSSEGIALEFSGNGPVLATGVNAGYFAMSVPVGLYSVTASRNGFVPVSVSSIIVGSGTVTIPEIILFPPGAGVVQATADAGAGAYCVTDDQCPVDELCVEQACISRPDAGMVDAGPPDAGPSDGGSADAGPAPVIANVATNASIYSQVAGFNVVTVAFDVTPPTASVSASVGGNAMDCGPRQAAEPNFTCSYTVGSSDTSGSKVVAVQASDATGTDSAQTAVTFDLTPLTLSVMLTPDSANTSSVAPVLTVTPGKPLTAAPGVTITPSGTAVGTLSAGSFSGSGTSWNVSIAASGSPVAGVFQLTARAVDDVGHTGSASATFTINTALPVFTSITTNATDFSAMAGFNEVTVSFDYSDLLDGTSAHDLTAVFNGFTSAGQPLIMTCGVLQAVSPNYTCTYDVTGTELASDGTTPISSLAQAALTISIQATNSVGSIGVGSTSVTFDFKPPALTSTSLQLNPAPNMFTTGTPAACLNIRNPLTTVAAATTCTDIHVELAASETLGSNPVVTAANGAISFSAASSGGLTWECDGTTTVPGTPADGDYSLTFELTDLVGNTATLTPTKPAFTLDTAVPAVPVTTAGGPVTLVRVPWGSSATGGSPSLTVTGAASAAAANDTVFVYAAPAVTSTVLGQASVATDGSFVAAVGENDAAVVWLATVDGAGNESPIVGTHNVSWTASFNGKVSGSTAANPNVMLGEGAAAFTPIFPSSLLSGEPLAGLGIPGADVAPELSAYAGLVPGAAMPSITAFTPSWIGVAGSTSPPGRQYGVMSYDSARGVAVLFGGLDSGFNYLSDTWEWNGATWTQLSPASSPPPRYEHSMAYDSARGVTVLYGGAGGAGFLGDTWEWNGTTWTQLFPAGAAGQRASSAMAYDAAHGFTVLFGGQEESGALNDTWLWNGTAWTQASPAASPPAREVHTLAYDSARGRTVLFGGDGSAGLLADTWEWDGTTWTQASPGVSPPARDFHTMAYDATHGVTVVFGGYDTASALNDVWDWDGTAWTQQFPTGNTTARGIQAMAYAGNGLTVMFGGTDDGTDALGDTWSWNGTTWEEPPTASSPPQRTATAMAFDAARSLTLAFGGDDSTGSIVGDMWAWDGTTWMQLLPETLPPARQYEAMSYDSARGVTVLFGGENTSLSELNDTWEWDGTTWTERATSPTPPVRSRPAMAYDAARGATILFGGYFSASAAQNDTWEWNGTTWTQYHPQSIPPARFEGGLVFDTARQVSVLFGGVNAGGTSLNDTWEWDGANWLKQSPASSPPARYAFGMAYDAVRGATVVFGGNSATGWTNDTWEWNGTTWTQLFSTTSPPAASYSMAYDIARSTDVLFAGNNGATNETWLLPSDTTAYPTEIAQFDFSVTGETLSTVALQQVSVNATAGGTGYSPAAPPIAGSAGSGATLAAWAPAAAGSWQVLASNSADSSAPAALSYNTTSSWQAGNCLLAGPWQTINLAVFPIQSTGNGSVAGQVAVSDPELTVLYQHSESECSGTCVCASDESQCGSICSDTAIDPQNCGGCAGAGGTVCTGGQWCVNSICGCPGAEQLCEGVCTDTTQDPFNCGGCGSTNPGDICSAGETCSAGACTPAPACTPESCLESGQGLPICDATLGECVQCATNADCACTTGVIDASDCPSPATPFCSAGFCVQCQSDGDCANGTCNNGNCNACPSVGTNMEIGCSGVCTNTQSNTDNCGRCGNVCGIGQGCNAGLCGAAP